MINKVPTWICKTWITNKHAWYHDQEGKGWLAWYISCGKTNRGKSPKVSPVSALMGCQCTTENISPAGPKLWLPFYPIYKWKWDVPFPCQVAEFWMRSASLVTNRFLKSSHVVDMYSILGLCHWARLSLAWKNNHNPPFTAQFIAEYPSIWCRPPQSLSENFRENMGKPQNPTVDRHLPIISSLKMAFSRGESPIFRTLFRTDHPPTAFPSAPYHLHHASAASRVWRCLALPILQPTPGSSGSSFLPLIWVRFCGSKTETTKMFTPKSLEFKDVHPLPNMEW